MNLSFLEIIGIFAVVYLIFVGVHEWGHVMIFKSQDMDVVEVSLLGFDNRVNEGTDEEHHYFAWVRPLQTLSEKYTPIPHQCWDEMASLNFTCYGMKLW